MGSTSKRVLIYALAFATALLLISLSKKPLHDVHWDTPIYLLRGKVVAQTPLLESYRSQATVIAKDLANYKPRVIDTPYWGFSRIGNSILLGAVTTIIDTGPTQLKLLCGFYSLLLSLSVALTLVFSISTLSYIDSTLARRYITVAAFVTASLYAISDVYRHMIGNLVAEVPALFLVSLCSWTIVEAFKRSSAPLAAISGVLAFLIYTLKVELVWVYISFILIFSLLFYCKTKNAIASLYPLVISGLTALVLYGIYAWWFYPLADPRLFLTFVEAEKAQPMTPVEPIKLWFVAGGLLWLGLLLALFYKPRHPVLWLSVGWLIAITLPHYNSLFFGHMAQVRYFALIMPPLFLASTLGWTGLFQRLPQQGSAKIVMVGMLILALLLTIISHAESYKVIKEVPGGWRLQYVKAFLSPPPYERRDFHIDDILEVTQYLFKQSRPMIVVLGPGVYEEYGDVIQYLGPPLPRVDPFDKNGSIGQCGRKHLRPSQGSIIFCTNPPSFHTQSATNGAIPVYYLHAPNRHNLAYANTNYKTLYSTSKLAISTTNLPIEAKH